MWVTRGDLNELRRFCRDDKHVGRGAKVPGPNPKPLNPKTLDPKSVNPT